MCVCVDVVDVCGCCGCVCVCVDVVDVCVCGCCVCVDVCVDVVYVCVWMLCMCVCMDVVCVHVCVCTSLLSASCVLKDAHATSQVILKSWSAAPHVLGQVGHIYHKHWLLAVLPAVLVFNSSYYIYSCNFFSKVYF